MNSTSSTDLSRWWPPERQRVCLYVCVSTRSVVVVVCSTSMEHSITYRRREAMVDRGRYKATESSLSLFLSVPPGGDDPTVRIIPQRTLPTQPRSMERTQCLGFYIAEAAAACYFTCGDLIIRLPPHPPPNIFLRRVSIFSYTLNGSFAFFNRRARLLRYINRI